MSVLQTKQQLQKISCSMRLWDFLSSFSGQKILVQTTSICSYVTFSRFIAHTTIPSFLTANRRFIDLSQRYLHQNNLTQQYCECNVL